MAADERWYFTKEQLQQTPSRRSGVDADKELSYRQQAANFIQDMGQRLPVNQLCINTAIVYMHRFYMFHSFTKFHRNAISVCALFLAAKVEEQPRKLEHVIKVAHICLQVEGPLDTKSDAYLEQAQQLVMNENTMLQTLGFDVAIDHPHTHIVKCCQLVRASKDLAQTSYFMATNSLHLTTMCLQCKPTVVACVCIHLACKWASWEIPHSSEGKDWFWYVEKYITLELLEDLTTEFLAILDKCPSRLKRKIVTASKEIAMAEKKGRADGSASSSGPIPSLLPSSLTLERSKTSSVPGNKQERSERFNRAERNDRSGKIQKLEPPQLQGGDPSLEKVQKPNKQDVKVERNDRHERLEKKERMEKEKRERTLLKEKHAAAKMEKLERCAKAAEQMHERGGGDTAENKATVLNNVAGASHFVPGGSHQSSMAVQNSSSCLPGHAAAGLDMKPNMVDTNGISSVGKKRHQNMMKPPNVKDHHKEHKDKREKERPSDKEQLAQTANTQATQPKAAAIQNQTVPRHDRIRHRKEENQSVIADTSSINCHLDVRGGAVPSASSISASHGLNKSRDERSLKGGFVNEEQKLHAVDTKRSKHYSSSPVVSDKNQMPQHVEDRLSPVNDLKQQHNSAKAEPSMMATASVESPKMVNQHVQHDKRKDAFNSLDHDVASKGVDQIGVNLSDLTTHPMQMLSPVDSFLPEKVEKANKTVEKHERHERKEKHKHKMRDKEKKEKHVVQDNATSQAQHKIPAGNLESGSGGHNQRIKLTIPKERLNSSNVDLSEKLHSPPKDTRIKLKIPKERLAPDVYKKNNAGDIPKLKIKIPKEAMLFTPLPKKNESRKRERDSTSPKDLNSKTNAKTARVETRSSRKEDGGAPPQGLVTSIPKQSVPPHPSKQESVLKGNGSAAMMAGHSNFSRKSSSKMNSAAAAAHYMEPFQPPPVNAGPYAYAQFYPCRPSMPPAYYPPMPATDFLPYFNQNFHQGPPLPPPPPDHGGPPLPREPPPPTPPPPPK